MIDNFSSRTIKTLTDFLCKFNDILKCVTNERHTASKSTPRPGIGQPLPGQNEATRGNKCSQITRMKPCPTARVRSRPPDPMSIRCDLCRPGLRSRGCLGVGGPPARRDHGRHPRQEHQLRLARCVGPRGRGWRAEPPGQFPRARRDSPRCADQPDHGWRHLAPRGIDGRLGSDRKPRITAFATAALRGGRRPGPSPARSTLTQSRTSAVKYENKKANHDTPACRCADNMGRIYDDHHVGRPNTG